MVVTMDPNVHSPSVVKAGGQVYLKCSCADRLYGLKSDWKARRSLARHILREKWGVEPTVPRPRTP